MKHDIATSKSTLLALVGTGIVTALATFSATAAVTPGGTFCDKAIFVEAGGGETLGRAGSHDTLGPVLVNDFDTIIVSDATYELNPSAADASEIALSSGRHLVLYNTQINDPGGGNRAEFQTNLTLAGSALVAGRAQGYIRRAGGADEAVLSGGAIITVANDDDILTLETRRSDTNTEATLPLRAPGLTAIQLLKLEDTWDYLSLERAADQSGVDNATFIDVAYDTINADSGFGSAFSFTAGSGDITLNETGLYLIFASTSIQKPDNNTRTQYQQRLTLDGVEVDGSATTTYARGNEDTDNGVAAIGRVLAATAGQVLNVEVNKEVGSNGIIQGGETAITMVKLPALAEYISLLDTTNQEVNDNPGPDPVTFATQVDVASSKFSHAPGGSAVTVNEASDYLFFGTVFTSSDGTNDNQDRIVPLHGWQIDGTGGPIERGRGAQYNRDNGSRTSGSWGAAILPLTNAQTVELTTQALGNTDQGADSTTALQGLSIQSLRPSNDPLIAKNEQLSLVVSTTGMITNSLLLTVDADDGPASLTYTVDSVPTGGTLRRNLVPLTLLGTFTQEDIDNDLIDFVAAGTPGLGGFDFTVTDGSAPASASFVVSVGVATLVTDDTGSTDEDNATTMVDVAASSLLDNDIGTDLVVSAFDASSTMGASVSVSPDGTFSYDPTGAPTLQALDDGDSVADTFTYTVTDFSSTQTVGNVTITLDGVNDDPVVVNDSAIGTERFGPSLNVLANDSDVDANDTISVVSIDGNPVGVAGLTLLTAEEATVTIFPDGSFSYEPCTSGDITSLSNGATLVDTIAYEVSDGTATVGGTITITSVGTYGASNDLGLVAADGTTNFAVLTNDDLVGAAGTPTAGAVADFNAGDVGNTDTTWINNGTGGGVDITMENPGVQSVLNTTLVGAPVGVTAAYDLSGTGSGASLEDADNVNSIYGANISTTDLTLEMVFRPDDLVGDEPLWGTGGNGTGASLVLLDDQLIFTAGQNAVVLQVVGTLTSTDYVSVIVTVDLATDTAELFIDGTLVDSSTAIDITTGGPADITDWSGTDNEGLGRSNGTTGGDVNVAPFLGAFGTTDIPDFNEANDRFDGEIAVLRIYSGPVLDATARAANATAIFGTLSTPAVGDIIDFAGETNLASLPVSVNLPSGAIATLEADGTVSYDPNNAFDSLGLGLEAIDTFQYTLSGGPPNVATVKVRITGTNTAPQVSIAADQTNVTEGTDAGFTLTASAAVASDVTVNLSYSGTASDGSDFTGQASRVITSGTSSADLDLATIVDSLFENGSETIIVTIDSVGGPATLGATTVAGTLLDDGDSAPVFTISGPGGNVTEGTLGIFTATASVASSSAITLDVAYSGTADASDYNGVTQVTLPAAMTSVDLAILPCDDGVADPGETLTATFSNPSPFGSMGSPDNASFTIDDGSGVLVFLADFEGVDPAGTPGGTLLNADAPFAADLGTAIGTWNNVPIASSGGDAPGVITEGGADVKGDGVDSALRLDRPFASGAPGAPGEGEICAQFDGAIDISGSNTGCITFDLASRRTENNSIDKSTSIIGLDEAGNKSFELFVDANNSTNFGPNHEQLFHVDSAGTMTALGNVEDFNNSGGYNENRMSNVRLTLTDSGYSVAIDRFPLGATPAPEFVIDGLAYAGPGRIISRILFRVSTTTDLSDAGGIFVDDVKVSGTQLTKQEAWRQVYFNSPLNSGDGADANDFNSNGFTNLEDFTYGFDPVAPGSGGGAVDVANPGPNGTVTTFGGATIWTDPATGRIYQRYSRRSDHAALALSITEQFSRAMVMWENSVVLPEVIAQGLGDGNVHVEILQTEFPFALPISGGKGRYGRIVIP